jgi:hypothetical protein
MRTLIRRSLGRVAGLWPLLFTFTLLQIEGTLVLTVRALQETKPRRIGIFEPLPWLQDNIAPQIRTRRLDDATQPYHLTASFHTAHKSRRLSGYQVL